MMPPLIERELRMALRNKPGRARFWTTVVGVLITLAYLSLAPGRGRGDKIFFIALPAEQLECGHGHCPVQH